MPGERCLILEGGFTKRNDFLTGANKAHRVRGGCLRLFASRFRKRQTVESPTSKTDGETNFTTHIARLVSSSPKSNKEAGMPKRTLLLSLFLICTTLLIFTWMVRDSLCELHFRQEKTELAAVLAYEAKR
jgi:protein HokA